MRMGGGAGQRRMRVQGQRGDILGNFNHQTKEFPT